MVKESLCAQDEPQCGLCEQQDLPSTWGERELFRFLLFLSPLSPLSGHFWLLLTGGRGAYRGVCCLSRLWNDCVGWRRRQRHERNVTGGYTDPHCIAPVQVWLMHAGWKAIKRLFFTLLDKLGRVSEGTDAFHSGSAHRCCSCVKSSAGHWKLLKKNKRKSDVSFHALKRRCTKTAAGSKQHLTVTHTHH